MKLELVSDATMINDIVDNSDACGLFIGYPDWEDLAYPLKCPDPLCDSRYAHLGFLKRHITQKHTHEKNRWLKEVTDEQP